MKSLTLILGFVLVLLMMKPVHILLNQNQSIMMKIVKEINVMILVSCIKLM